jgi:hypothetical protein
MVQDIMMLDTATLILKTDRPVTETPDKLRGFVGGKFPEYSLLHHHVDGGYLRTYPKVQYKVIEGTPFILGIEEGAQVLKDISSKIKELELGNNIYKVSSRQINEQEAEVIATRFEQKYRFLTPWLGLNQNNIGKFEQIQNHKEKKLFLNNIIIGNILSMCKGLGIIVDRNLYVHSHMDIENTRFKSVHLKGFTGEFTINFKIPDFFGIGKSVSHGYGTVKNLENQNE